jgi:hypothetical protein
MQKLSQLVEFTAKVSQMKDRLYLNIPKGYLSEAIKLKGEYVKVTINKIEVEHKKKNK